MYSICWGRNTSFCFGFASALRFDIIGSQKVEDCRECTIATCVFSPAQLISRFQDLEDLEVGVLFCHHLSLLFTKFDNSNKGLKTLTFEVLKYDMLITFRTFYRTHFVFHFSIDLKYCKFSIILIIFIINLFSQPTFIYMTFS